MTAEPITLREHLERIHDDHVTSHRHEHEAHASAHEREHELNQQAINKAEASVDKAVGAARETMDKSIEALGERLDRSEGEQRRRLDEFGTSLHQMGLDLAAVRTTAENGVKGNQALSDSQTWIVRLVIGVVVLAILALIVRPGLI